MRPTLRITLPTKCRVLPGARFASTLPVCAYLEVQRVEGDVKGMVMRGARHMRGSWNTAEFKRRQRATAHIPNSFWRRLIMCSHRYLHHAVPLLAGAAALLLSVGAADARVTRIVISQTTSPAFNGQLFGTVGPYEMLRGTASGEIDP